MNDSMEVGLIDSTRKMGKPFTWGSGQQEYNSLKFSGKIYKDLEMAN